jgi:hypothetical protein
VEVYLPAKGIKKVLWPQHNDDGLPITGFFSDCFFMPARLFYELEYPELHNSTVCMFDR